MVCGSIPLRGVWNFKIVRAVRDSERAYHFRLTRVLQPVGPGRIWQSAIVPRIRSPFVSSFSPTHATSQARTRAFRPEVSLEDFPIDIWARVSSRCLRRATRSLLADCDSRGYRPLRVAVTEYLGAARSVRCDPDQVIIVSGIQHGLDLTIRTLVDAGDAVCLEDPCHPIVAGCSRSSPRKSFP